MAPRKNSTDPADPAPWLDLLPAEVGSDAYRADVRAEARARARHDRVDGRIGELEAQLAAGLSDPDVDPLILTEPASELATLRALRGVLPPVPVVEHDRHLEVARALPKPYAGLYVMPHPPRYGAELVHFNQLHAPQGEFPPVATEAEVEVFAAYEELAARNAAAWRTLEWLDQELRPSNSMADRVTAWSQTVNTDVWQELRDEIASLANRIAEVDAQRPPHNCPYLDTDRWHLQGPARVGDDWTLADAVRAGVLIPSAA